MANLLSFLSNEVRIYEFLLSEKKKITSFGIITLSLYSHKTTKATTKTKNKVYFPNSCPFKSISKALHNGKLKYYLKLLTL